MMDEDRIVKIAINGYWRDASPKAREDARWHVVCALTAFEEAGLVVVPRDPRRLPHGSVIAGCKELEAITDGQRKHGDPLAVHNIYRAMIRAAKADPQ